MDLLASYSDDGDSAKNTPTRMDQMLPKVESTKSDACLEAEWESFEKMISGTGSPDAQAPPPLPVGPPELSVSSEQSYFSNMSEPPTLSNIKDQTQFFNHADPPTLTNSTEPMTISDDESTSTVTSPQNPLKLTDIILPSQYDDEMPVLTKITGSPLSSEHSRSRSSSSSSRSSSADSVRSEERKKSLSPVSSKRESSPRKDSSNSKRKDEKRDKRSRSRSPHRSRSRSPHRRRRRSSDRKRSRSKSRGRRRSSERKQRSRSHGKRSHHGSSRSHRRRRSGSRTKRRQSREKRSSRDTRRRSSDRSHRRDRRDHSKERRRRSRSNERRRSRSRSPTRGKKCITRAVGSKPLTFKEQMRQQLLKASKMLSEQADGSEPKELPIDTQNNMPLSASSVFASVSAGGNVTPQMALLQTMAAMHQKAQEMTGVAVPRFYNPAAVNPLKYAEQVQKRKLLWGKNKEKKEDEGQGQWQGTAFVSDNDGKMAAKFRKLMGMKEGADKDSDEEKNEEQKKKTEEMFYRLDKEYEFARMTTHTHRGIGLGFQSQGLPNP
ncbi:arginine/serine-rich coiled-coil protein 2-like isoform X2 [Haliotis rufescens]|uniref:arginine/serine-rich coiled-coil protein 2-like isoform X2 n=1 Tax=Haliotis rufescens TaxID=6454 RepID=UPI001EAF9E19|nr:arginine/serine-rich coiled-coil protein 2-like isoform X2 [Haliotis rufescens]